MRTASPFLTLVAGPLLVAVLCEADGGPREPVQRGPEVTGARSDKSPGRLDEMKPAERKPGRRVHPIKPVPRPKTDTGDDASR